MTSQEPRSEERGGRASCGAKTFTSIKRRQAILSIINVKVAQPEYAQIFELVLVEDGRVIECRACCAGFNATSVLCISAKMLRWGALSSQKMNSYLHVDIWWVFQSYEGDYPKHDLRHVSAV